MLAFGQHSPGSTTPGTTGPGSAARQHRASAAYLTVSEIFPLEMRGLAIAIFYAAGTLIGGITGPIVFGSLMQASEASGGNRLLPYFGYILTGSLMIVGGAVEFFLGIASEQKSLEDVSTPLSAAE